MNIQVLSGFEQPEPIIELFREYTHMLVETDPTFARYLVIQNYDRELEHLGEKYPSRMGRPPAASRCTSWMRSAAN